MDFIGAISKQLGIPENMAQAAAGATLGMVQKTVSESGEESAASAIGQAIPELDGWKAKAAEEATPAEDTRDIGDILGGLMSGGDAGGAAAGLMGALGGGGGAGGLLGGLAQQLGGPEAKQMAALVGVFGKLGIDPAKAAMAAPIALDFLKERLDPGLLDTVLKASPMLLSLVGGGDEPAAAKEDEGIDMGDIAGALGKLF